MQAGERIGPLAVEKELGSGAMGTVFLARHTQTGEKVAIKVMLAGLTSNPKAQARFEREADVLKQLRHPNIVRLVASGRYRNKPFYAMEFIEGESLDKVLERRGRLSWQEAIEIGTQVCAALQHVHDAGILHRDLKPSNVMITREGIAKLTDFGIAKDLDRTALTSANYTVGTAAYMSPEQCRGDADIDHQTDLYSLGVMLFELITGRRPFEADSPVQMLMKHLKAKPPRISTFVPDVPPELDSLVDQLLEKKREHRPRDARTVGRLLDQILTRYKEGKSSAVKEASPIRSQSTEESLTVTDATFTTRAHKTGRRRWSKKKKERLYTALGLSAILIFIVGVLVYVMWPDPDRPLREAIALYEQGENAYKSGQMSEANSIWYDAIRKLERVVATNQGERAERARGYLRRIEAATILNRINAFLEGKENWEAVQRAAAGESLRSSQFRKDSERIWAAEFDSLEFAEQARSSLAKLEVPWLIEEITKLAHVQEPKTWNEARDKIRYFFQRYGSHSDQAEARNQVERIRLRLDTHQFALDWLKRRTPREIHSHPVIETALQALECEQAGDWDNAKKRWELILTLREGQQAPEEWKRYAHNPDLEGWLLLAEAKLQSYSAKSAP
ncbi:Serine/threonine-protein kinase StkP [bacterium HR36]|nr:Serine/threonine-protein kinase StkP [bacterium HR36]